MTRLPVLLITILLCSAGMLRAQDDPMDQYALVIAPSATLDGDILLDSLRRYDSINGGGGVRCLKNYGATFQILGYRGDSVWWATSVERCDSSYDRIRPYPSWVLIYRHRIGVVPKVTDCQIIGRYWPMSAGAELLTGGNYDADSFPDVVIRTRIFDSTNLNLQISSGMVSVWWGGANGYSGQDSSLLTMGGYTIANIVNSAFTTDLNMDGVDDIVSHVGRARQNGVSLDIPRHNIYLGSKGQRWGRDRTRTADREWWNAPTGQQVMIDQDCDGVQDYGILSVTTATVLYRDAIRWFDTTQIEQATSLGSTKLVFSDLTGDGVPELVFQCTGSQELRIYAGRAGQRLREQVGSGSDAGDPPDATHPVSRPWHRPALPHRINDEWAGTYDNDPLAAFDANGNGTPDILSASKPLLCLYTADTVRGASGSDNGFTGFDHYIDAAMDTRLNGTLFGVWPSHGVWPRSNVVMGLEGGYVSNSGMIWILIPHPELPVGGFATTPTRLPHTLGFRCQQASGVEELLAPPGTRRGPGPDLSNHIARPPGTE